MLAREGWCCGIRRLGGEWFIQLRGDVRAKELSGLGGI